MLKDSDYIQVEEQLLLISMKSNEPIQRLIVEEINRDYIHAGKYTFHQDGTCVDDPALHLAKITPETELYVKMKELREYIHLVDLSHLSLEQLERIKDIIFER